MLSITDKTLKRLQILAEKSNMGVDECLNNLIDEEEKMNDEDYLKFCKDTEEALKELENDDNQLLTVEELFDEMDSW